MSMINNQRVAAVAKVQALGYSYSTAEGWTAATSISSTSGGLTTVETDAMLAVLMRRADALAGCTVGSEEEAELASVVKAIEAYEAKRWPDGKEPGGKG